MLTELVKAIEEKKQTLERELAAIHDKNTTGQFGKISLLGKPEKRNGAWH